MVAHPTLSADALLGLVRSEFEQVPEYMFSVYSPIVKGQKAPMKQAQ